MFVLPVSLFLLWWGVFARLLLFLFFCLFAWLINSFECLFVCLISSSLSECGGMRPWLETTHKLVPTLNLTSSTKCFKTRGDTRSGSWTQKKDLSAFELSRPPQLIGPLQLGLHDQIFTGFFFIYIMDYNWMNARNRKSISKYQNGKFEAPGIKCLIFGKFRRYLWKMLLESKVLLSNNFFNTKPLTFFFTQTVKESHQSLMPGGSNVVIILGKVGHAMVYYSSFKRPSIQRSSSSVNRLTKEGK